MNTPIWSSSELPTLLGSDLAEARADARWRRELAPEMSYGRHAGPARADARQAAVAIVLCWNGNSWSLPLTVRCASLTRHGGQVSLPGGLAEAGESSRDAAIRELTEELGCHDLVQWLGPLDPIFVYASNAVATPWVAACETWPEWIPHPPEVDRVLRVNLRDLMQQPLKESLSIVRGPVQFRAPQLIVEDHSVWGATAVILAELRGRLLRIESTQSSLYAT